MTAATTTTSIPTEVANATDAELAAWAKALNAGTMSCPIHFGQAIFAEITRRRTAAPVATADYHHLHTLTGVGYEIVVGVSHDASDTWAIWYAGQNTTLERFDTQAAAIAAAANMVLADLAAETGTPQGGLVATA